MMISSQGEQKEQGIACNKEGGERVKERLIQHVEVFFDCMYGEVCVLRKTAQILGFCLVDVEIRVQAMNEK